MHPAANGDEEEKQIEFKSEGDKPGDAKIFFASKVKNRSKASYVLRNGKEKERNLYKKFE